MKPYAFLAVAAVLAAATALHASEPQGPPKADRCGEEMKFDRHLRRITLNCKFLRHGEEGPRNAQAVATVCLRGLEEGPDASALWCRNPLAIAFDETLVYADSAQLFFSGYGEHRRARLIGIQEPHPEIILERMAPAAAAVSPAPTPTGTPTPFVDAILRYGRLRFEGRCEIGR